MQKLLIYIPFISLLISSCTSTTQQETTLEGNKVAVTVSLTYIYQPTLDIKPVQDTDAINLVINKCTSWRYHGAQAFGDVTRSCHSQQNDGGCSAWIIKKTYQCIGK
jgi:hypothetical protein